MSGRVKLVTGLLAASWLQSGTVTLAEARVDARIEIPEAEVYVLGDDIQITWEFTNRSTNSVAMLWEGCCRLNGKLDITSDGRPVEILPPGAAAFHSYSKAAELKPNEPSKFDSLLSDWVRLPGGGAFEIAGRYTGVLPTQSPQVAEGLSLWRGTAVAGAESFQVLSVAEYLEQREDRSRSRGLAVSLSGPTQLPPLEGAQLTVAFENRGESKLQFRWPGATQLWIVDESGFRLPKAVREIRQPGEVIRIQSGETVARTIPLSSADLNGGKFGQFKVFLDLAGTQPSERRLPSSAVDMKWDLSVRDVGMLLNEAAGGPSIGMRNPALKLLRVYLEELSDRLGSVPAEALNPKALTLKNQLQLADCLRPISPKPGLAILKIGIGSDGGSRLILPRAETCGSIVGLTGVEQLGAAYKIRRHLGWDIGVELTPEPGTHVSSLFDFAEDIDLNGVKISRPAFTALTGARGETNVVNFLTKPGGANVVIRMNESDSADQLEIAVKRSDPKKPIWMNSFSANEIASADMEIVPTLELHEWLENKGISSPRILVDLENDFEWGAFLNRIQPIWSVCNRLQLVRSVD